MQISYESCIILCDAKSDVLNYRIGTELPATAVLASAAAPYGIEMLGGGIDEFRVGSQDSRLEIPCPLPFHPDSGSREIR